MSETTFDYQVRQQMIEEIQKGLKDLRKFLFFRGKFFIDEGSASLEELIYLTDIAKKKEVKLIGEIGFNAGSSSYAFLKANPLAKVVSFDLGTHGYVKTAKKFIDKTFPGRHILILGDSTKTVPQFKEENPELCFDVIFIDGGHEYETVRLDIENMKELAHENSAVVIDDLTPWLWWGKGPTRAWLEAIDKKIIIQKEMFKDGKLINKIEPPGQRSWALGYYNLNHSNGVH